MPDVLPDILAKIRKLIEHEKSAREIGSLAEAEAFALKVSELCDRYRIAVSEVPEAAQLDDIGEADWAPSAAGQRKLQRQSRWQRAMANGIAWGHYCAILVFHGRNDIRFVGAASDIEVALAMMTILCRAAEAAFKAAKPGKQKLTRDQFLLGFAIAICSRYRQQRSEQEAHHADATHALVRLTSEKVRERYAHIPNGKPLKEPRVDASLKLGYDAGMKQDLNLRLITEGQQQNLLPKNSGGAA